MDDTEARPSSIFCARTYTVAGIIAALLGLYVLVAYVVALGNTPPAATAMIITALLVFLIGLFSWKYEKDKEIASAHRRYKAELYENFLVFVFNHMFMGEALASSEMQEKDMLERVTHFNAKVMLWGDDGVVRAWNRLREELGKRLEVNQDRALMCSYDFEKLVYAMRRDLGYRDRKLRKGDLLPLFMARGSVEKMKQAEEEMR